MNIIRIGNDINVIWRMFSRNGMKFSLEGKILKLWLISGPFKKEITDFEIQLRNEIHFFIDADDLHRLGVYKILLSILDDQAVTEDASIDISAAFQLVSKTYIQSSSPILDGSNIILSVASVLNNIETSPLEGASAYEIAVKHGYEGTEEEWLESLRGDIGPIGKSAYQSAVDNGFDGTEAEWVYLMTKASRDMTLVETELEDVVHHVDSGSLEDLEDPSAYATRDEYNELRTKIDGMSTGKYYGFHASEEDLPEATDPGYAYVGESAPYALWNFDGLEWKDSGVTVDNAPVGNEEDIDHDEAGLLKLADRPTSSNQMGYVILRKNKTFAEQVTQENTIYEIRYAFDLSGEEVTIPAWCVLKFVGGQLSNGTIEGDATNLSGHYIFKDIVFEGTFVSEQLNIDETHFKGDVDFYGVMECFHDSLISLGMDINVPTKDVRLLPNLNLNGNGHTIKVVCLAFAQTANVKIQNCIFDCSIAESTLLHVSGQEGGFLDLFGDGTNNIEITDCKFNDIPGGFSFTYFRNVLNVRVEKCEFDGTLDPENVQDNGGYIIYLYTIDGSTKINSCRFTNCHGVAICGLGNTAVDASFEIKNNFIANIAQGGIVFFGGLTHNIFVSNNTINDVNLVESATSADHSCINFHGFNNAVVCNNSINAPKATGIDIDGSLSGSTIIEKGENAKFYGNNIVCRNVIFWVVKNVEIYENVFDLGAEMGLSGQIDVRNNVIKGVSTSGNYVIIPERASGFTFDLDITFYGNKVIVKSASTSDSWYLSASGIPGIFRVRGTSAILERNGNLAMIADNAGIISIEDGYEIITKRVNLSVASKEVLIPRNRPGALMNVVSFSIDGSISVSPSVNLSIGLARPGVAPNDSQFGTITISGTYNANTKTHSWIGTRPNNTEFASIGDVYLVCPGGGQDAYITLEFKYLYGYKPYY